MHGIGIAPGLPDVVLEPDVVFLLFLPLLMYSMAYTMPQRDFWTNRRPIGLLAVGMALLTMCTVAIVVHALLDDSGWPAAFTFGAIVFLLNGMAFILIGPQLQHILDELHAESWMIVVRDGSS